MAKKTPTQLRLEKVAKVMERFDEPLPLDYDEFVRTEVLPTYIFYNGKKGTGYCTTCRSDFKIKGLKHKKQAVCPVCGRKAIARSEGYSRREYEYKWSSYLYTKNGDVFIRYFRHMVDYTDYRNPYVYSCELFRSYSTEGFSQVYMYETRAITAFNKWDIYSDGAFFNALFYRGTLHYLPEKSVLYRGTELNELLKDSPRYRYCPFNEIATTANLIPFDKEMRAVPYFNISYALEYHCKLPLEKLLKIGMPNLAHALAREFDLCSTPNRSGYNAHYYSQENRKRFWDALDMSKDELVKTLKLDKARFNILRAHDNTKEVLKALYFLQDHEECQTEECFGTMWYLETKGVPKSAFKYATKSKIAKYAMANENYLRSWGDYIEWKEKLGCDLHDEYYLFPKNLLNAHDETHIEYLKAFDPEEFKRREKTDKLIMKARNEKAKFKPFSLHYCGLFIRLAESSDELRREGEALHHCVGTYADKVAEGKTTILFVRKESEPDKPFYTMEWNGKIVQLRGMHNCAPTSDVEKFRKEFEKAIETEYAKTTQKVA